MGVAYEAACADFDSRGRVVHRAMSCRGHSVGVQQDAAAKVRAAMRQADDVGELARRSGGSANDIFFTLIESKRLRQCCRGLSKCSPQGDCWHCKCDDESENWCHFQSWIDMDADSCEKGDVDDLSKKRQLFPYLYSAHILVTKRMATSCHKMQGFYMSHQSSNNIERLNRGLIDFPSEYNVRKVLCEGRRSKVRAESRR